IMVDITGPITGFTAGDLSFMVGNDSNPTGPGWSVLGTAPTVVIQPNAGIDNANRVEITFPDGTIKGQWLQVTVANTHTLLAAPDVFYFGNAPGETGDSPPDAKGTILDGLGARANLTNSAAINNLYDFNRDGKVDATDFLTVTTHQTNVLNALNLIAPPVPPAAPSVLG